MRTALRWVLALVVLIGTAGTGTASAGAVTTAGTGDIRDRLLAVEGMSLIEEKPVDGYRFFVLAYEQPVDHRRPWRGTFDQRISILHKSEDRPTVFFTSGYGLHTSPSRSEPTRLTDGNQVSMEYRFFTPSRPQPADWSKLDIWQAASDQHRIYTALRGVYDRNWIATGGSKGGMTATYYRRFYPHDMDGTVAYVAPNNTDIRNDRAYDRFFATVSTEECRERLNGVQREAFVRRDELVARYETWAGEQGYTFDLYGSADRAFEVVALDLVWAFFQYQDEADCAAAPDPDATTDELYDYLDAVSGFAFYTDQGMTPYTPYYYQAGTELGFPSVRTPHLAGLLRYPGIQHPRHAVPDEIPMPRFDRHAMKDIDRWVRTRSAQMLYVNGEMDPWGAEPFRLGSRTHDTHLFTAPGANHGANIAQLAEDERALATDAVLRWAGLVPDDGGPAPRTASAAHTPAPDDAELDRPMVERRPPGLP
ncbi:S28 family serine protease [Streptomyces sp. TRM 70351]|uniref:S28 family serine protease n=1 Tax=Streptomyces sp. TRM 70351 TaxID=3116552 RepID=UPI002E7B7ECA|nr:S28 family serine protease [Streptomyces sp. TRM 70351]MEE1928221.1 S28 family serine protease [Streptomyces sp. TRM 70351]